MLVLVLPLLWSSARADEPSGRGKDTYLEAFMESHATPGAAAAPSAAQALGNGAQQGPYPAASPQPQYGAPSPQPQYGAPSPQPQYGAPSPQPQYGAPSPQPQYGAPSPQPQYGAPSPQPQYGAPSPQPQHGAPSSQPQYGAPSPQPQYGAPSPQPQYGAPSPQPQYGAPTPYGAATVTTTTTPIPFLEGLGAGLWSLLSQLPLPDFQTALKILLKVVLIKGVIKIVSLLLVMLFIPKLEDILTMVSSLMEVEMDMDAPDMAAPSKPDKPAHKPDHHDGDQDQGADDVVGEDAVMDADDDASADSARRGRAGAVRSRMLNALATRVEEAVSRTAASVQDASAARTSSACSPSWPSWPRCGRDQHRRDTPPKKVKKKVPKKNSE